MKISTFSLLAIALSLAATVIGARADDTYYNQRNAAGYITYEHYPTYEVRITRDSQNLITREDLHSFADDLPAAQAPLTLAPRPVPHPPDLHVDLSEFARAARAQTAAQHLATVVATPFVMTAADTDTTESDRKAAIERAKVDAAQHAKNVKAAHAFRNGE
jgi:hypothetical protein